MRRKLHFARAAKVSDRKLRLFTVSCCRLIQHALPDARSREAVEVAERFAEGLASQQELHTAYEGASAAVRDASVAVGKIGSSPQHVALFSAETSAISAAKRVADWFHSAVMVAVGSRYGPTGPDTEAQFAFARAIGEDAEALAMAQAIHTTHRLLLWDIIGNPFRPVALPPSVLAWNSETVARLARVIYDENAFDRMPVLGDALEEAGCDEPEVLAHCRHQGWVHVRGCWVVDLLLGMQ